MFNHSNCHALCTSKEVLACSQSPCIVLGLLHRIQCKLTIRSVGLEGKSSFLLLWQGGSILNQIFASCHGCMESLLSMPALEC